jgi:hypothetical protein
MSSTPDDEQPAEEHDVHQNYAAYLLGRNVWFIQGWLNGVQSIALVDERRWEWAPPKTIFGTSFDIPPDDHVAQINDALVTLVEAKAVEAAVLVELHRAVDVAAEECASIAELAREDRRGEICELYESATYNLVRTSDLQKGLLQIQNGESEQWRQFGDLLGKFLFFIADYFEPGDFADVFASLFRLGRILLPKSSLDELDQLYKSHTASKEYTPLKDINDKLISIIKGIDVSANEILRATEPTSPYLVLDDTQKLVEFLGVGIAFETFQKGNALGGIAVLRVLMSTSGKFITAGDLIDKGRLAIEPHQLYAYISRYRKVIRGTKNLWPDDFKHNRLACKAFIVSDRTRRRRGSGIETKTDTEGPSYKLDLSPIRIRLIEHSPH